MKTLITLSNGTRVAITNSQMWQIALHVAWALAWPMALALAFGLLVAKGCHLWK